MLYFFTCCALSAFPLYLLHGMKSQFFFFLLLHHIVTVNIKTKHRSWTCTAGAVAKIRLIFKSSHCVVQKSLEYRNLKWIAVGWKPVTRKS